jgi:hypothetical protein
MPKYVVHIGPPKTGSTYLQSTLFHARKVLLADGINYPDVWWKETSEFNHDGLFLLLRENRFSEVKETLQRINSANHRIVVLSSENFEDLKPHQLEGLRDAIGANPVEIVFYCRSWCERIPSAWKQDVKMGSFSTLPEFYATSVRHPLFSGFINSSLIWTIISNIFGRKSLKLVSYNSLRDQRVDLFRHFTETFLGWTGTADIDRRFILDNASPNAVDMEILRALNSIDHRIVGKRRPHMYVKFTQLRSEIDTRAIEEWMAQDVGILDLSDGAEPFRMSWKEMNSFGDCQVPKTWFRRPLFQLKFAEVSYIRGNYLLLEGAGPELRALYKHLDAAP